jgi:hypothetical protein
MNAIFTMFSAVANLARSLNRMASVVDRISEEAERRVEVIGHQDETPALELNGRRTTKLTAK